MYAQAEYSHFSLDFRLKLFLWIFLDNSMESLMWPKTSCRNAFSIEHTAGPVFFVAFFLASFAVWRKEEFYTI